MVSEHSLDDAQQQQEDTQGQPSALATLLRRSSPSSAATASLLAVPAAVPAVALSLAAPPAAALAAQTISLAASAVGPDAQGMFPPALRAWVERSFAQCTRDNERTVVEREFLQRVAQGGLDQVDWDAEPLIDMRAASPSGSEAPWRRPTPDAVPMHTGGGRARQAEAAGAAEREMLTDETLAARPQPRLSHKEQMARLAEAAHAAEVEALAARVTPRSIYAQQRELQAEVARAPPRLQLRRAESQACPRK